MNKKVGAPTTYNLEIAEEICDAVADTTMMLEDLCEKYDHWPAAFTIYRWRRRHPEFGAMYAIAKQHQIEVLVSSIFKIARDRSKDYVIDSEGKMHFNGVYGAMARAEIDAIKWLSAKLAPKIYGERKELTPEQESFMQKFIDKLS